MLFQDCSSPKVSFAKSQVEGYHDGNKKCTVKFHETQNGQWQWPLFPGFQPISLQIMFAIISHFSCKNWVYELTVSTVSKSWLGPLQVSMVTPEPA